MTRIPGLAGWLAEGPGNNVNSFHLVARRTSGGNASRAVDETEQSGSTDNPLLLPRHSHLPELSMEVSGRGRRPFAPRSYIARTG